MVVGDDDQTIYEWRGARPNYILQDFVKVFNSKPVMDYHLCRSFRFGPLIAQCAANLIACNTTRVEKPLIAFQSGKLGSSSCFQGDYRQRQGADRRNPGHARTGQRSAITRSSSWRGCMPNWTTWKPSSCLATSPTGWMVRSRSSSARRSRPCWTTCAWRRDFEEPLTEQRCGWLLERRQQAFADALAQRAQQDGRDGQVQTVDGATGAGGHAL